MAILEKGKRLSIEPVNESTLAAGYAFVTDTIDLLDEQTRFTIAWLLERQVWDNHINTIRTDPARHLHLADPDQVNKEMIRLADFLRKPNSDRDDIRRMMGLR